VLHRSRGSDLYIVEHSEHFTLEKGMSSNNLGPMPSNARFVSTKQFPPVNRSAFAHLCHYR